MKKFIKEFERFHEGKVSGIEIDITNNNLLN